MISASEALVVDKLVNAIELDQEGLATENGTVHVLNFKNRPRGSRNAGRFSRVATMRGVVGELKRRDVIRGTTNSPPVTFCV